MSLRRLLSLAAVTVAVSASAGSLAPAGAIVNGSAAPEGAYPFMAAVVDGTDFQYCGGSVIATGWVLTAAHCIDSPGAQSDMYVITGRTDLSDTSKGQRIKVTTAYVDPLYEGNGYDAALLKLATATTAPPITLATAADDGYETPGTTVRVAGWGDQTNTMGLTATNQLRYVDLQVVSDSQCGTTNFGFDAPTGVCAAALLKDSCQGDSGGPLFANYPAKPVQIGVVSYGTGCGVPEFPGVYSEVNNSQIRSWITSVSGV